MHKLIENNKIIVSKTSSQHHCLWTELGYKQTTHDSDSHAVCRIFDEDANPEGDHGQNLQLKHNLSGSLLFTLRHWL